MESTSLNFRRRLLGDGSEATPLATIMAQCLHVTPRLGERSFDAQVIAERLLCLFCGSGRDY